MPCITMAVRCAAEERRFRQGYRASTSCALGRLSLLQLFERRLGHISAMVAGRCQVRKGEKATTVVFWKELRKGALGETQSDDDERESRARFFARGYCVFNANQVDGYESDNVPHLPETERIARAEAFFAALNIPIVTGGDQACYRPDVDTVFMPPFNRFLDAASYYSCLGHETAHATAQSIVLIVTSAGVSVRQNTRWTRSSSN